ncbi:MAG: hypothetical protein ACI4Q4_10005 [Oscillospiraceae bacterium]
MGESDKKFELPFKVGDRRYAIAYMDNPRVVGIVVMKIDFLDDSTEIAVQSIENPCHIWFLKIHAFFKWCNFRTREEAEKYLDDWYLKEEQKGTAENDST